MKFSIITATYNSEKYLVDCINSVIKQDCQKVEHIIVDGCSIDKTLSIVKSYKEHFSVVISEKDSGIYDAMNKGISCVTGDVIGILNSDDYYANSKVLSDVENIFKNNEDVDVVYGNLHYVRAEDTTKIVRVWKSKPYYNLFFEFGNVPPHPSFFVRKGVYDKIGLFDTSYKLASDYDLMFRILKINKSKSMYLDEVMVKMRLGGATNKNIKNIFNGNLEIINIWRKNGFKFSGLFFIFRILKRLLQLYR